MRILLAFMALFGALLSMGQQPASPQLPNVVPPAPDAQSLGKFGEVPVGLFTGIPNISIPLFEMKVGNFTLPISISYHASGVKVEEVASSVGMGWALDAGGTLSRSINGTDDYLTTGFVLTDYKQPASALQTDIQFDYNNGGGYFGGYEYYYAKKMADREGDSQPDIFFYNFCGQSGKFYIDQDRQFHPIPFTPLKFQLDVVQMSVIITDLDGNKYFFNWGETSFTEDACGLSSSNSQYLSKILLNNNDSILFDYDTLTYSYKMHGSIARPLLMPGETSMGSYLVSADCFGTSADAVVTVHGIRLKSITSSRGQSVEFTYSNDRSDLSGTKSLNSVALKYNGATIKTYSLYQSYFTPAGGLSGTPENNRLRLDSVKTNDQLHKFVYDSQQLPGRLSYAQDHWGFYNGRDTNTTLLPKDYEKGFVDGANRDIDTAYTQAGILKKIIYPTGGHTLFEYESNSYHYTGPEKTITPRSHYLAGAAFSTQTDTFTVHSSPFQILNARVFFRTDPLYGDDYIGTPAIEPPCVIELFSDSGYYASWQNTNNTSDGFGVTLTPGHYTMSVRTDSSYSNTFMWVRFQEMLSENVNKNVVLGGLRVKRITSYQDSLDAYPVVKAYRYIDPDSSQFSSGRINFKPVYVTGITYTMVTGTIFTYHNYYRQLGQPVFSLGSIHGGSVGYTNVETWEGAGAENGKTISKFSFTGDTGGSDWAPLVPSVTYDWESGYLTEEAKYKNTGAGFELSQKVNNYYSTRPESEFWNAHFDSTTYNSDNYIRGWGISIGYKHGEYSSPFIPAEFKWNDYHFISKWVRLDSTQTQAVDQSNSANILTTKIKYAYSNPYNLLATSTQTINSKGDTLENIKRYPHDTISSLDTEAGLARTAMIDKWQIRSPLEEINNKNSELLYTQRSNYKRYGEMILPDYIQTASFFRTLETRINFNKYDESGNVVEVQKTDDVKRTYLWDYDFNYPITECVGADSSSIAYTSFEAGGRGNWLYSGSPTTHPSAPTGTKGYSLAGADITKSGLSTGITYVVTYWKRDSSSSVTVNSGSGTALATRNGWILYQHEITGTTSATVSGTAYIDELRLYPRGALMTTYTYSPLIGMTSQCDANNRISYYEYDSFNRLRLIKDQDKNIVKVIDYQYKQSQNQ